MSSVDILLETYQNRLDALTRKTHENALLQRQIDDNSARMFALVKSLDVGQRSLQFVEDVANSRRSTMRQQIEAVVSEAVIMIYGTEYKVALSYDVKHNRSCLDMELVRITPHGEIRREMNGFGGGVSDVISVPLRLLILLSKPDVDRICVLDEAYKHVDMERIQAVAEFITLLSKRMHLQTIMCSHHEIMREAADCTWLIEDDHGESKVTKIS